MRAHTRTHSHTHTRTHICNLCIYTQVILSEIFPYELRATAMSMGLFINRLISGLVATSFLSITMALTASGAFVLFGVIGTASFIFVLNKVPAPLKICPPAALLILMLTDCKVPETKGRSLEEMEEFFKSIVHGTTPAPPAAVVGGTTIPTDSESVELVDADGL